ncbi:MAG: IS1595 family transposase, partial [Rhodospirillales bacterium]|nr:IS1595 family transposase [Rhodospirillales bacterium]
MSGILEFMAQFGEERRCIEYLATLRWPDGYVCSKCGGCEAWRLTSRPRVYQCTACAHQESVTSGTVFHRTRTPLPKWFLAAYLMGRDKRGVSAKFLERELEVAYQTAWSILHKLRHGLSEDAAQPLCGYLEADESYAGGRGDPSSPGRSLANPDKSLVVLAVEKKPAPKTRTAGMAMRCSASTGFTPAAPGSPCC